MVFQSFGSGISLRGNGAWEPRWTVAEAGQLPIERGATVLLANFSGRAMRPLTVR
jgi:hypothetical protein